jgi:hypothetical protein
MTMSGHPENFGWIKCSGCGAHRPPDRIATANGTIAGVCMEGCTPLRIEEDARRCLRIGSPEGNDVAGPVVRSVEAAPAVEGLKCERCRETLPHAKSCSATLDPELCS